MLIDTQRSLLYTMAKSNFACEGPSSRFLGTLYHNSIADVAISCCWHLVITYLFPKRMTNKRMLAPGLPCMAEISKAW